MSFVYEVGFIKRLRLMMVNEGPRDSAGELLQPFRRWVVQLEKDIGLSNRVVLLDEEAKGVGDGHGK